MALSDPPGRDEPLEPLRIVGAGRVRSDPSGTALMLTFNRSPTDDELRDFTGLPPIPTILADARQFAEQWVLADLVVKLFRQLILGGLVLPETPAAMDWLRDYIDGNLHGHGPTGRPMIWPEKLPGICNLMRGWGFQPTPTVPGYVMRQPRPQTEEKAGG